MEGILILRGVMAVVALTLLAGLCPAQDLNRGVDGKHDEIGADAKILETPPFKYYVSPALDLDKPIKRIRLVPISSRGNDITDDANRFKEYNISHPSLPQYFFTPDGVADPTTERSLISIDPDSGALRYAFDFQNYMLAPDYNREDLELIEQEIRWAVEEEGVLYVSHSHQTYARSSRGMNAYITAIDSEAGSILWRSQPLVSNSENFVVVDDVIVTGYGFTDERDFLYILNRWTGAVLERVGTATAAHYIIRKDDELYVRCYDTDYVFRILESR